MAWTTRLIFVILIFLRPIAGCCECHAPILQGIQAAFASIHVEMHSSSECDCCDHSSDPCLPHSGTPGSCGSCESTEDFVKVASPQIEKTSLLVGWLSTVPACGNSGELVRSQVGTSGESVQGCSLRAHLVLGVLLI